MRKSIISSLMLGASAFASAATVNWGGDFGALPSGFYKSGTSSIAQVTTASDTTFNVTADATVEKFLFQSSGKQNGNLTLQVDEGKTLTFSGTTFVDWNAGAALDARYKAMNFIYGTGTYNFTTTSGVRSNVSSYLLATDPAAVSTRKKQIIFAEGSNVTTAMHVYVNGAFTTTDSEGNLMYETQEYINNSSFDFNGKFYANGTLVMESNLNGLTTKANVNIGSKADVSVGQLIVRDGGNFNVAAVDASKAEGYVNFLSRGSVTHSLGTVNVAGHLKSLSTYTSSLSSATENQAFINVASGGTLDIGGGLIANIGTVIVVDGTLNVAGYLNLERNATSTFGSTLTINEGATVTAGQFRSSMGPVSLAKDSKLIVKTADDSTATAYLSAGGAIQNVASGAYFEISSKLGGVQMYNSLVVDGTVNFNVGGLFQIGSFKINTSGNTVKANVAIASGFSFTTNAENDLSGLRLMTDGSIGKLAVNADTTIGSFAFKANSTMEVTVAEGQLLTLLNLTSAYSDTYGELGEGNLLVFKNFAEKSVLLQNHTSADDSLLSYIRINSASDTTELSWVFDDTANGWFLSAAVPEPAEWAAIFGAIALAAALYRRRK